MRVSASEQAMLLNFRAGTALPKVILQELAPSLPGYRRAVAFDHINDHAAMQIQC